MYNEKKETEQIETYSPRCGVAGCNQETIVHISKHNVTRCAKHYCEDYDRHRNGHIQVKDNPERFTAEDDIMDSLADCDMLQKIGESKSEYAKRCKLWCSQMMGGQFRELVKDKSGTL